MTGLVKYGIFLSVKSVKNDAFASIVCDVKHFNLFVFVNTIVLTFEF